MWNRERFYKIVFEVLSLTTLLFLVGIVYVLFSQSIPLFFKYNIIDFIFGGSWYPTQEPPEFGILPLILASLFVTLGALIVAVPLGVGCALYINEIAKERYKPILKSTIEVISSIPSIIFGLFGMVIVSPFIQRLFDLPTGLNAFTASLILGIMTIPTVSSISEDALSYVPQNIKEASYALGANRWQTLIKVTIPAAGSGISTALILGMSRAIGETMIVLMVSGGAATIPKSIFQPVRPMTSTIAAEMGEAVVGSTHYNALFAIGLILFIITLIFNIIAEIISKNYRVKLGLNR